MITRRKHRPPVDAGFTLIELVVAVAIVGIMMVSLTGVVIEYLKTNVATETRFTESHDVQFASAYWQRDVASIGVRSTTYDNSLSVHTFPLLQSVNVPPGCALPTRLTGPTDVNVVTLAWTEYDVVDPDHPSKVTVTYVAHPSGARFQLVRVRCTGGGPASTATIADNLAAPPAIACPGAIPSDCTGSGSGVPTVMTIALVSNDPSNHAATDYTATLSGERRQS